MERTLLPVQDSHGTIRERYLNRVGLRSQKSSTFVPNVAPLFATVRQVTHADIRSTAGIDGPVFDAEVIPSEFVEEPPDESSINSVVTSLISATLGVGALGIPYAFLNAGLVCSVLILLLQAWLSVSSIKEVISALKATDTSSFEEVSLCLLGKYAAVIFETALLIFCLGTAIAYHISISEIGLTLSQYLFSSFPDNIVLEILLLNRTGFLITITFTTLLPLALSDAVADLRVAFMLGITCVVGLAAVLLFLLLGDGVSETVNSDWSSILWPRGIHGLFAALGTFTFALCCQPNVPTIFAELPDKTIRFMGGAVFRAVSCSLSVYCVVGISGLLLWGSSTGSSVFDNLAYQLSNGRTSVALAYAFMAIALSVSFPLNIFPIKITFEQVLSQLRIDDIPKWSRFMVVGVVTFSLVCALYIPNVGFIFDVVGVTAGALICFIYPAAMYLKILSLSGALFCRRSVKAWVILACGFILLTVGTLSTLNLI